MGGVTAKAEKARSGFSSLNDRGLFMTHTYHVPGLRPSFLGPMILLEPSTSVQNQAAFIPADGRYPSRRGCMKIFLSQIAFSTEEVL